MTLVSGLENVGVGGHRNGGKNDLEITQVVGWVVCHNPRPEDKY